MIDINLLSNQQKKDIRMIRLYSTTKKSAMVIFIFAAAVFVFLSGAKIYLSQQKAETVNNYQPASGSNYDLNSRIRKTNNEIDAFLAIYKISPDWSDLLSDLLQKADKNIEIKKIQLSGLQGIIEISGTAKTREDLIKFNKELQLSGWFSQINLPLEMLTAKENNFFSLRASINMEKLLP